jgi:hypothetical protein
MGQLIASTKGGSHASPVGIRDAPDPDPRSERREAPPSSALALTGDPEPKVAKVKKPKREPKHTELEIADKAKIVDAFVERFEAKKGVEPAHIDAGDNAAVFRLAKI